MKTITSKAKAIFDEAVGIEGEFGNKPNWWAARALFYEIKQSKIDTESRNKALEKVATKLTSMGYEAEVVKPEMYTAGMVTTIGNKKYIMHYTIANYGDERLLVLVVDDKIAGMYNKNRESLFNKVYNTLKEASELNKNLVWKNTFKLGNGNLIKSKDYNDGEFALVATGYNEQADLNWQVFMVARPNGLWSLHVDSPVVKDYSPKVKNKIKDSVPTLEAAKKAAETYVNKTGRTYLSDLIKATSKD